MEKFQVDEVFTPASPAIFTFVERRLVNKRLVRALRTPGMQIILYGHSGCGKTTLMQNKLFQVYERHITTRCMKDTTFDKSILDAFDQLTEFYLDEVTVSDKTTTIGNLSKNFALIKAKLERTKETSTSSNIKRILPPQLTPQSLANFLGTAGYCWILEDFHKLSDNEKKKFTQLMKVFMDSALEHKTLKLVLIGAEESARQVIQTEPEMKGRVAEIHVPLMSRREISYIVIKGFSLLNIGIKDDDLIKDIIYHSSGLAAICHKLCSLMCEIIGVTETVGDPRDVKEIDQDEFFAKTLDNAPSSKPEKEKELMQLNDELDDDPSDAELDAILTEDELSLEYNVEIQKFLAETTEDKSAVDPRDYVDDVNVDFKTLSYALNEYIEDSSDTIKSVFEKAFNLRHAIRAIEALTECERDGANRKKISEELMELTTIDKAEKGLDVLKILCSEDYDEILRFNSDSGIFSFSDPIYRTFALAYFESNLSTKNLTQKELSLLINKTWGKVRAQIIG